MLTEKRLEKLKQLKEQNPNQNIVSLISKSDLVYSFSDGGARTIVVSKLFDWNLCTAKDLIDGYKEKGLLKSLISRQKIFKQYRDQFIIKDLKYLLNTIDDWYELRELCDSILLIKRILNEFILDKSAVDKLNTMIENDDWCKKYNIHTIFDLIELRAKYRERIDQELLKLNELNRKLYVLNNFELTEDERNELVEISRDSEQAQNTLIQIEKII